jgi:hypothetical protein
MKSKTEITVSPMKVAIAAPFPRQCKTCRKTLTHANRRGYMRALKEDSECASCAARGIRLPFTDGSGFPRECPVCHKEMMYRYAATAAWAKQHKSICKACSNSNEKPIDIQGQRFGLLVVTHSVIRGVDTFWVCKCDCRGTKEVRGSSSLRNGNITSCGCRQHVIKVHPSSYIFRMYQQAARRSGREFDLTVAQVRAIISQDCEYCGEPPFATMPNMPKKATQTHRDFRWNGIDRIDSSKGYVPGNVVPCCTVCNIMKLDHSHAGFIAHIEHILAHCGRTHAPHLTASGPGDRSYLRRFQDKFPDSHSTAQIGCRAT